MCVNKCPAPIILQKNHLLQHLCKKVSSSYDSTEESFLSPSMLPPFYAAHCHTTKSLDCCQIRILPLQNLESRGMMSRNPVVVQTPRTGAPTTTATSILHLPRFAPRVKLGSEQVFRSVQTEAGAELQAGESSYTVQVSVRWRIGYAVC